MERLTQKVWNSSQNWYYETLYQASFGNATHKLKIKIRVNAYEFQSWGKISRWDGTEWQEVATISGQCLKTKVSYFDQNVKPVDFWPDEQNLLDEAAMVLS